MHYLKYIAIAVWITLVPVRPAIISVMALPLVDLCFALTIAKRSGQSITSSGLKRTVAKILMYEAATVLAFIVETYLINGWVPIVKTVTGIIGMTELKSCLEHLDDLGGNKLFGSILAALAPQNQQNLTQVNIVESNTGVTPVQEPPK
jgi:hypothetical protein